MLLSLSLSVSLISSQYFLQFKRNFLIPLKLMALSIHKALPDLSKLEPLDGTNYRCWSQRLVIFFEQLEVDYVLFSNLTEENNTAETTAASSDGIVKDKSKTIDEEINKKFEKDNKTVMGHLLNHMTNPCSICLSPSNLSRSFGRN